jgi:putative addiction module component (TIGR02574 family)
MTRSVSTVFADALGLAIEDRARLAARLIESLDGADDGDAEEAWRLEIERRLARIAAGQASAVSIDAAVARMHRAARGR